MNVWKNFSFTFISVNELNRDYCFSLKYPITQASVLYPSTISEYICHFRTRNGIPVASVPLAAG